ncbi:thioredoxin family protein [Flagellimonas sp.]|uniref:thioredoxin family protein n=1 Tax=Flagellimonas sp. TaxID=2058762 RepID=UPI003F49EB12
MKKTTFYHAGCPVCVSAEHDIVQLIGSDNIDIVHLGENKSEVEAAEKLGVVSVPALVTPSENVLHINFGASIEDLK